MNLKIFLSSKRITLCALGIGGILLGAFAALASLDYRLILLFESFYLAVIFCWLMISFILERRKTERLETPLDKILGSCDKMNTNGGNVYE